MRGEIRYFRGGARSRGVSRSIIREKMISEKLIGFERRLLDRLAVPGLGGEFNRIRFNARNHGGGGGGGGGGSFSIVVPDLEQGEVARCLIKVI